MIILASDHAGFTLKNQLLESGFLDAFDSDIIDLNPEYDASDDYPDIVESVTIIQGYEKAHVIGICGSGQGICMALNKLPGIRSGFGYTTNAAKMMRLDNNANGICFSGKNQSIEDIQVILKTFFTTNFSDADRHHRRVRKLDSLGKVTD
jgi:ribose 5-phosphate isomerase B